MAELAPEQVYPSDLTDAQWAMLEPLLQRATGPGRPTELICVPSSTRCSTRIEPAANGVYCQSIFRPTARCGIIVIGN